MVKLIYKEFKTALNKLKYPDSWFWNRYTVNPYSGCEQACIYCDARSQRYYLQDQQDFEARKYQLMRKILSQEAKKRIRKIHMINKIVNDIKSIVI